MNKEIINFMLINFLGVLSLFSVSLFYNNIFLLSFILGILSMIMLVILKDKNLILTYFFCAIMGAIAEIIAINFGAWTYTKNNYLGVPFWLPFLWGIAALYMISLNNGINFFIRWFKNA